MSDRKLQKQQFDLQKRGLDLEEQRGQQQDTNSMLGMLSQLYGLQQEQQMNPEKLRALQLSNASIQQGMDMQGQIDPEKLRALQLSNEATKQGIATQQQMDPEKLHALQLDNDFMQRSMPEKFRALQLGNSAMQQGMDMQKQNVTGENELRQAQIHHLSGLTDQNAQQTQQLQHPMFTPEQLAQYHLMTNGKPLPPELMSFAPQEYHDWFAKQAQEQEAQRQAAIAADQAQQQGAGQPTGNGSRAGGLIDQYNPYGAQHATSAFQPGELDKIRATREKYLGPDTQLDQHPMNTIWNKIFGKPVTAQ